MASVAEQVAAFYEWRPAEQRPQVPLSEILEKYDQRETELLRDIEQTFPDCAGWVDARAAFEHLLLALADEGTPPPPALAGGPDKAYQAWHAANAATVATAAAAAAAAAQQQQGTEGGGGGGGDVAGVFRALYAEADEAYDTNVFSERLRFMQLHAAHETPAEAARLNAALTQTLRAEEGGGRLLDADAAYAAAEAAFEEEEVAFRDWLRRFYARHNSDRLASVDAIAAMPSSKGATGRRLLKMQLFWMYAQERYARAATWSPSHAADHGIRDALTEFFQITNPGQLVVVDAIVAAFPEPADAAATLARQAFPSYHSADPATELFPPWRNEDFPDALRPKDAPRLSPEATAAARADADPARRRAKPSLEVLEEQEYPPPAPPPQPKAVKEEEGERAAAAAAAEAEAAAAAAAAEVEKQKAATAEAAAEAKKA
eukprot:Rhum_TRINITY_DN8974_c0_g1::Rhum_TRINITY_DN8974_c0_g1_i1::g.30871::m.30871